VTHTLLEVCDDCSLRGCSLFIILYLTRFISLLNQIAS
jgi:hypothetical protein